MNKKGYWLKEHDVYHTLIVDIGFQSHIRYLIRNHSAFQISREIIETTFAKYKERMGFEGRAREELMTVVLSNGWIRVRHHLSPYDHWIIQCDDLSKRKTTIQQWLLWGLEKNAISDFQPLVMEDLKGERIVVESLKLFLGETSPINTNSRVSLKNFTDELNKL